MINLAGIIIFLRFLIQFMIGSAFSFLFLLIFNDSMINGALPRHGIALFFIMLMIAVSGINILLEIATTRNLYEQLYGDNT